MSTGTLLNISYSPQQYVHGTSFNMLDCKMTSSLSPITPVVIQHESSYMGMWEQEGMNNQHTKLSDMMDLMEPSLAHSTETTLPTATIHHHQNRDCHFPSSQYLTPLPTLNDSYCPSECQILDGFNCSTNSESAFHKYGTQSFSENYDNFISDFPPPSHHHHHHLQHPNSNQSQNNNCMTGMMNHSGGDHCSPGCPCSGGPFAHPIPADSSLGGLCHSTSHPSHTDYNWDDLPCDPGDYSMFLTKGDSPTTSDSISYTDVDSEMDSKSSGGSLSALTDICHVSPPKRKVGRPPKKDKKLKRNEKKTGRLWEFIRDLLKNPEYCPSLVRWENPEEGHFRFVNSEKVAQLWGQIKGNPRMTYEKLSRAMRYYYKSHVFEPVLGRRLVYKFGYNAKNWRPVNPNFVTVQKLYTN